MQAFVIVLSTTKGITTSHFDDVFKAIATAEQLPQEAHFRILGICSTHGITDYSDGFCADCYEEYCIPNN